MWPRSVKWSETIYRRDYRLNIYGKNFKTKDGTGVRDFIDVEDISNIHLLIYKKMMRKNLIEF